MSDVLPGGDRAAEHARELVSRLRGRGLRASGAPHAGGLTGAMAVSAQRVDVHPYAGRLVVLLPSLRDPGELFWHWQRPLRGRHVGARWFQPFHWAGAYDDAADTIAAAIDADVHRRGADTDPPQAPSARRDAEAGQRQVLDTVGRPLHKLVYRQLVALDELQKGVEDPALLRRLYEIDHLAMRTLRGLERIAVLGGAMARRLPEPLPLPTVMRVAASQVEHYPRVRIPPSGIEVDLSGDVAPEITLLLAELIENATRFSPRDTEVLLTAAPVPAAGLRVEVCDRGLPMPQDQRAGLNRLLAAPGSVGLREQIVTGPIGLLVVARLAERHRVRVVLHPRDGGGTRAVVELPEVLLLEPRLPLVSAAPPPMRVITGVLEPAAEPVPGPVSPSRTVPAIAAPIEPTEPVEPAEAAEAVEAAGASLPRRRTTPAAGGLPPLPRRVGAHRRAGAHRAASGPGNTSGSASSTTAGADVGAAAAFLQGVHDPAADRSADQPADQAVGQGVGEPPPGPPPDPAAN